MQHVYVFILQLMDRYSHQLCLPYFFVFILTFLFSDCWNWLSVTQLWPTLCNPMDWTIPARLLCSWNSTGKNTGVGCHSCLQGIFPTQGLNLVSYNAGRFFTIWATREALKLVSEFISFLDYNPVITCKNKQFMYW